MMKVQSVSISNIGGPHKCEVTFQIGPQSYNRVVIELDAIATRAVVELAITKAVAQLEITPSDVVIAGEVSKSDEEPLAQKHARTPKNDDAILPAKEAI